VKHIFVINPIAGKNKRALKIIPEIEQYFSEAGKGLEYQTYITKEPGDATRFVREISVRNPDDELRFYACGGDGTLMEVLNGVFGYSNAVISFFPLGSANDYIKNFFHISSPISINRFMSIDAQVNGTPIMVDTVDCNGLKAFNICAVGMDADVGAKMVYFKNFPLVTGPMAYSLAIIYMLFHKIGRTLDVTIETQDGIHKESGDYLFCLGANGQYYGGGHRAAPQAVVDDGAMDVELIRTISRFAAPGFLKKYKHGKHLDMDIVKSFRSRSVTIRSDKPVTFVVDGESGASTEVVFKLLPASVKFVLPR